MVFLIVPLSQAKVIVLGCHCADPTVQLLPDGTMGCIHCMMGNVASCKFAKIIMYSALAVMRVRDTSDASFSGF